MKDVDEKIDDIMALVTTIEDNVREAIKCIDIGRIDIARKLLTRVCNE